MPCSPTSRRAATPCALRSRRRTSPFRRELRRELLALQAATHDEIVRAARAANKLADLYAHALRSVCLAAGVPAHDVVAAGVHGQTMRHRPEEGWTLQLNNPARIAEQAYMTVVADFRSRDVAAGGQGAPLVPAFHAALFGGGVHRVVVNIGGIANLTDLPAARRVQRIRHGTGQRAARPLARTPSRRAVRPRRRVGAQRDRRSRGCSRCCSPSRSSPRPPPKSTGRDLFNAEWLDARLAGSNAAPADVQATLVALTATTIADAIVERCVDAEEILVCGGGAHNAALMEALARALAPRPVVPTSARGVPVDQVEALAFAWLAREALAGRPGNLPAVTGARGPRVLGAIYPR